MNIMIKLSTMQMSWTMECGGLIDVLKTSSVNGTISSPNYPNQYFGDLVCNYTLLAPGRTIYGTFEDFNIEEALSGRYSFLNIRVSTLAA